MTNLEKNNIKLIHSPTDSEPFIVISKPARMPSAPLNQADEYNALSITALDFPEIKAVQGKKQIEYGLLHRLDTITEGLILIATTQQFYDYMNEQQNNGSFEKTYTATCIYNPQNASVLGGFPEQNLLQKIPQIGEQFTISSMFRPFGLKNKEVRPVTEKSNTAALNKVGKKIEYKTTINITDVQNNRVTVECKINAGFRHQVRNHLAWIGLPIINDPLYNEESLGTDETIMFKASEITFFYNNQFNFIINN